MASKYHPAHLLVKPITSGLLIRSCIPEQDDIAGDIAIELHRGESFGGHTFDEWALIASGAGSVSADWLEV